MNRKYKNPIAKNGDFADPFVLRYNGIYYLYATNPDIRCFSSENLLDWSLEAPVIDPETFEDLVPFAPEVVCHDGKFYMYTSPSGFGHYVLESDSPTGPFRKISGNVGHAIDGTVFMDDDGKWYFYWAGEEGIWGCEMKSPTEFSTPVLTGADLHGWTEGPLIVKQKGIYYMTYTGNHYLSKGYRIQAAWSKDPLSGYQDDLYNPVVVHTQGEVVGLGHSSTVTGPDLVSHYIVYHNLNEDATRDLNIDRILWQGESTQVLGATRDLQPAPKLPEASFPALKGGRELAWIFEKGAFTKEKGIYYSGSGGLRVWSGLKLKENFTAELHLLIPQENEDCGIDLQTGDNTRISIEFFADPNRILLRRHANGSAVLLQDAPLNSCRLYDVLHRIGIQMYQGLLSVSFDGRNVLEPIATEAINKIGYFSKEKSLGIGFTAVTNTVCEEAAKTVLLPAECSILPAFGAGASALDEKGRVILEMGQTRMYRICIPQTGSYKIYVSVFKPRKSAFQIGLDGTRIGTGDGSQGLHMVNFQAEAGEHSLMIEGTAGITVLERLEIAAWQMMPDHLKKEAVSVGPYGKSLAEEMTGDDYVLETAFVLEEIGEGGSAGILLRVSHPAEGGEGADPVLGIDFFKGYCVHADGTKLIVSKHCYDRKTLGETSYTMEAGLQYHLSIMIKGNIITVKDKEGSTILEAADEHPLTRGCAGIWAENSRIRQVEMTYAKIK